MIDGATADPALTQRLLVIVGLPPLHAKATDNERRLDLEVILTGLQDFGVKPSHVRWIARALSDPSTAFVQLHPSTNCMREILDSVPYVRNPLFGLANWQSCELRRWSTLVTSPLLCDRFFNLGDDGVECKLKGNCRFSHRIDDFMYVQKVVAEMDEAACTAKSSSRSMMAGMAAAAASFPLAPAAPFTLSFLRAPPAASFAPPFARSLSDVRFPSLVHLNAASASPSPARVKA